MFGEGVLSVVKGEESGGRADRGVLPQLVLARRWSRAVQWRSQRRKSAVRFGG